MTITVEGKTMTPEEYRLQNPWMDKDTYRDMVFEVGIYGEWEAPNGDIVHAVEASS